MLAQLFTAQVLTQRSFEYHVAPKPKQAKSDGGAKEQSDSDNERGNLRCAVHRLPRMSPHSLYHTILVMSLEL